MNKRSIVTAILGSSILALSHFASAATFMVINNDGEHEGLNDQRAVEPVAGNSHSTLGDQRMRVVLAALEYVGGLLATDLEFKVAVQFDSLSCDPDAALLGGGAPVDGFVDFGGAPKAQTLYPSALANFHAAQDLDPEAPELELVFNSDIDFNDACLDGTSLYYGLDEAEPEGYVNFYSVVLHEVIHAIGFMTYMDGHGNTPYDYSDPFLEVLFNPMTGQHLGHSHTRSYSLLENHPLVFFAEETRFRSSSLSQGAEHLATAFNGEKMLAPYMYTPRLYVPGSSISHWDTSLVPQPLMGPFSTEPVIVLSVFELAALHDIGWLTSLPRQDRDGDGVADRDDGFPDDPSRTAWPEGDENGNDLPDEWEAQYGIEHQSGNVFFDADQDGLPNITEYAVGTDPTLADTDGDGLGDLAEVIVDFDPLDSDSCPTADCTNNFDRTVPSVSLDLDYYIHEDVSPDRVAPQFQPREATSAADGGVFISGYADASGGLASQMEGRLVKLDANGELQHAFGRNGQITTKDIGAVNGNGGAIVPAEDSQGRLYASSRHGFHGRTVAEDIVVGTRHLVWEYGIYRTLPSGKQDEAFAPIHVETVGIQSLPRLGVDAQDRLIVAYETKMEGTDQITVEIKRYMPSGEADPSFGADGTFRFEGSASLRLGRLYLTPTDDMYLLTAYLGAQQFAGTAVLKVASDGKAVSEFGDSPIPGLLQSAGMHSIHVVDHGFYTFSLLSASSSGHEQVLQVREYDHQGSLNREHIVNSMPFYAFNTLSCAESPSHWVCVVDTSWTYTENEQFQSETLYAQVFDRDFNAIGQPLAQPKIKFGGQPFDSESIISILYADNNTFTIVSELSGANSTDADTFGVRRFSTTSGWDLGFGEEGLLKLQARGAAEVITSFTVDEMQHSIVGFSQLQNKINSTADVQAGLLHFYPNGERDHSFGPDGFIPVPSDPDSSTYVLDVAFDAHKNLLVLAGTRSEHDDPGDRLQVFEFSRLSETGYRYSSSAKLIHDIQLAPGRRSFDPELLALPDRELILKFAQGIYDASRSTISDPSVDLYHLDSHGNTLSSIWGQGHYQLEYPGLTTYTAPNFYNMNLGDGGVVKLRQVVPPELPDGGTYFKSFSIMADTDSSGDDLETHLFVSPDISVDGILPLPDVDEFFVYGSTCLLAFRCNHSYFGYYAVVDSSGAVDNDFNGGYPVLVFQGQREHVAFRNAYRVGSEFLVTATMDRGFYVSGGSSESPKNAGNAFYAIAFNATGQILGEGAFVEPTQEFEIYADCEMHSNYSGTCAVLNDHFTDVRALRWQDSSRIIDPLVDSDDDGIPDVVEIQFGIDPNDDGDALSDLDMDGVSNLVEYQRGTNMAFDDVAPDLTAPADVTLYAIGAYTPVDTGQPLAIDARDGVIEAETDAKGFYPPGQHQVVWTATDSHGNQVTNSQYVTIKPLVSLVSELEAPPGSTLRLRAATNGSVPPQGGFAPLDFSNAYQHLFANQQDGLWFEYGHEHSAITLSHANTRENVTVSIPVMVPELVNLSPGRLLKAQVEFSEDAIPSFEIAIQQTQKVDSWVEQSGGDVVVALVSDLDDPPPYDYSWAGTDPTILASAEAQGNSLTVDPSQLTDGYYRVSATVANGSSAVHTASLLRVGSKPSLSIDSDSDSDGEDDWSEGSGDENENRIPDYLDPDHRSFLLPLSYDVRDFMQADAVFGLRLGKVAFSLGLNHPLVTDEQIQQVLGPEHTLPTDLMTQGFQDQMFEFEITGLGRTGGWGGVVLPARAALPSDSTLVRLTVADGWRDVSADSEMVLIASASKINGVCPAGQHDSYATGLISGSECIRLLIKDGGDADFDGAADGTIRFLGGVGVEATAPKSPPGQGEGSGGNSPPDGGSGGGSVGGSGGGGASGMSLLVLALLVLLQRRPLLRSSLKRH